MSHSIVFLIPSLDIGGAQRQLVELADGLHRADWQVKVLTFYGGGELEADLRARGVPLVVLNKRGRWDLIAFSYRLLRTLRRERPDVLHAYLGTADLLSVLVKPWVPRLRVVWGVRASNMDFASYDWLAGLAFRVSCRLAKFADLIICNSVSGRDFHAGKGYPATRMVVIPNGIDTDRFRPDPIARGELRSEWGIAHDQVLIGVVGRLDPMKDYPTFLRAAAPFTDRHDVRFVCIGDGLESYRRTLKGMATELGLDGSLTWVGARTDMPRVYNAFDLAVSSSSWGEGFPNVIAEAMATAVPCVVTDVGDSPIMVGDDGWVCRPQDPTDLARAIESAVSSKPELAAIGQRARQRVRTEFSTERLVAATAQQLDELLSRST
jgi:glycosyltransferase involved in cell wall biosynthesis